MILVLHSAANAAECKTCHRRCTEREPEGSLEQKKYGSASSAKCQMLSVNCYTQRARGRIAYKQTRRNDCRKPADHSRCAKYNHPLIGAAQTAGRAGRFSPVYWAGLKIAPTAPLLVVVVTHVQDLTLDSLPLAGQPLGSGMTGAQLLEKPPKRDPGFGDAVRATGASSAKFPVQPSPPLQLMWLGLLTTLPDPSPASWTVKLGKLSEPHDPSAKVAVPLSGLPGATAVTVVSAVEPRLLQAADAVTTPAESIVATRASPVDHFTWAVKSRVCEEPA